MIRKLNNRGLTAVELIVSFALVSIITIAMFGVVNRYRDKENMESFKNTVTTYKNTLTQTIYNDIIANNGLNDVIQQPLNPSEENTDYYYTKTYTLTMANGNYRNLSIAYHSKCFTATRDQTTKKRVYQDNQQCVENANTNNTLNIDYNNSEYYVEYNGEKFDLPKIEGLRFNEIAAEKKADNFILIHIGLFHNDYGNAYDALNVLIPSSIDYPGRF